MTLLLRIGPVHAKVVIALYTHLDFKRIWNYTWLQFASETVHMYLLTQMKVDHFSH